ncbi:MAG: CDP-glycerol glycerophosphotransferase family protein [Ruminococcus sp.]|nr:CDP-glycerol glycerophosphotransferase family protein [Ruminococcus sp.]
MSISVIIKQYLKTVLQKTLLPICYNISKKEHIDSKLVILADSNCADTPESMLCMKEELLKRGYRVKEMYLDFSKNGIVSVMKFMVGFMKVYANARAVFICNYFVPVTACKKREETTVIQLWHGCGCMKKFGYDSPDDISPHYKGNAAGNFDIVTVSGQACVKPFQSAFRLPEGRVLPLGVSRTDMFFRQSFNEECKRKFFEKYPEYKGRKILLYAPTFRGNASEAYCVGKEYIVGLQQKLGEGWAVIIKMHPRLKSNLTDCDIATNRLFPVVDLLVTDYSSLIFEYSLFKKPAVFFVPDLKEYSGKRSFYLDYEKEMYGDIVTDGEKLYDAILRAEKNFDVGRAESFAAKYMSACDGNSSARTADLIDN